MLAKSKLDSIETLVSQALIDMEISHEEFNAINRDNENMRGWKKVWGMSVTTAPLKTRKYGIEQCEFKKYNELVTDYFHWLKDVWA